MLGTVVNTVAIIIGGLFGIKIKHGLKEKYKIIIMQAICLSVLFIGGSTTVKGLLDPDSEPILFIISLVIGGIIGERIGIERGIEKVGDMLQKRISKGNNQISQGFVSASLLFCVGTMAVLGALESGLQNNHSMLYAKSILDGITAIILSSSLGIGVVFSAISVFVYQGSITLFAGTIEPYLTADIMREISTVGGILIFSLGLTMFEIKKIKTGNLLPSIFVPVFYYLVCVPLIAVIGEWVHLLVR